MVTVYRKDDLTGIELEGTGLKLDDMLANGYTTDKSEAVALSTTAGGSNFTGGGETTDSTPIKEEDYLLIAENKPKYYCHTSQS